LREKAEIKLNLITVLIIILSPKTDWGLILISEKPAQIIRVWNWNMNINLPKTA
jgi:hypothetical protein